MISIECSGNYADVSRLRTILQSAVDEVMEHVPVDNNPLIPRTVEDMFHIQWWHNVNIEFMAITMVQGDNKITINCDTPAVALDTIINIIKLIRIDDMYSFKSSMDRLDALKLSWQCISPPPIDIGWLGLFPHGGS